MNCCFKDLFLVADDLIWWQMIFYLLLAERLYGKWF